MSWRFGSKIVLPMLIAVLAAVGVAVFSLIWMTAQSDSISVVRQVRATQRAIDDMVARVAQEQETVAIWDEPIIQLRSERPDWRWFDKNIGKWLSDLYGHDQVFILDQADRSVFAYVDGHRVSAELFEAHRGDIQKMIDAVRGRVMEPTHHFDRPPGHAAGAQALTTPNAVHDTHLVNFGGRPAAVSVMRMGLLSDPGGLPRGSEPLMINIRFVGDKVASELARRNLIDSPRFSPSPKPAAGEEVIGLTDDAGRTITYFHWRPELPGSRILAVLGPAQALLFAAILLIMIVLILRLRRSTGELHGAMLQLSASEEHHRSLIELHPQTPWVADASGEVIEAGSEWEQITGRPVASACGDGWMRAVAPEDLPRVSADWSEAIRTGSRLDVEFRVGSLAGEYRWYRSRAAPRVGPTGEVVRWYGLLEDIHDRQLALQALLESERRLRAHRDELEKLVDARTAEINEKNSELARLLQQEREVNALQRRFVAMVSHEFRTPLTIIDAAAQRLARMKTPPTAAYLSDKSTQIKASVARMVELMESILAAGRLEKGVIAISKKSHSIADLINTCALRRMEISPTHCIHCDLSDLPKTINIDVEAIDRVFTNLLSNAVKYAPLSPDIHVRGWSQAGWAHISVQDHGIGMHEEDIPRLFEPYFRAQSAAGIAGTGIGLNIVHEILDLHGGCISVVSEVGFGSTFTVSLPLSDIDQATKEAA